MAAKLPSHDLAWAIVWPAVALIATSEGCRLTAYRCPAGVATIGYGETVGIRMGMRWTQAQADQALCVELEHYADKVRALCAVGPGPNELGAFVSLAYNVGIGAFAKSTVLRAHNAGNASGSARAFSMWNKAKVGGVQVELPGLTARRAAEAALYLQPDEDAPAVAMPQAVAAESKMAASPIAQSGAVTAGAGVLTLASSINDGAAAVATQAGAAQGSVTTVAGAVHAVSSALHVSPGLLLAGVLLAAGLAVLWHRLHQRAQGWA